jgi:hypothetical protein
VIKFIASILLGATALTGATAAQAAPSSNPLVAKPAAAKPAAATPTKTATGPLGQVLKVDASSNVADGQMLTVTGKGYDLKTGIYVTFCVIPAKGKRPELCGPFDITGQNNQAVWVSSNPPIYAITLVKPFDSVTTKVATKVNGKTVQKNTTTGSFTVQVPATQMIGTNDCKVLKCAILTRADHTRSDYRKADVIIPVTFK